MSDVNLLLLDEPTNHLDIYSREQVEEALEEFDGTILAISHDRYFLDRIVDRIVEVRNPTLVEYAGSFSDYWAKRRRDRGALREKVSRGKVSGAKKKAAPRTETRPSSAPATEIEQKIDSLERQKLKLEEEIVQAYQNRNYDRGEKTESGLAATGKGDRAALRRVGSSFLSPPLRLARPASPPPVVTGDLSGSFTAAREPAGQSPGPAGSSRACRATLRGFSSEPRYPAGLRQGSV